MRISDWSSDVCSSDLPIPQGDRCQGCRFELGASGFHDQAVTKNRKDTMKCYTMAEAMTPLARATNGGVTAAVIGSASFGAVAQDKIPIDRTEILNTGAQRVGKRGVSTLSNRATPDNQKK